MKFWQGYPLFNFSHLVIQLFVHESFYGKNEQKVHTEQIKVAGFLRNLTSLAPVDLQIELNFSADHV